MNDKKRLNAEGNHKISKAEKDAWNKGKNDALKNLKMNGINGISSDKAVQIVKLFADGGNEQFIRQKVGLSISDIRKTLAEFNIKSIEDARAVVKAGLISELDKAVLEDSNLSDAMQKEKEATMADKMKDHEKVFGQQAKKTDEEKDLALAKNRDEAFRKNKADKIRSLIAQGIGNAKPNAFRINIADVTMFKSMIPYGVSQLQRRFGGSKADIVAEIKRLSPGTDIDVLRP